MESILVTWDVFHWLRSALKLAAVRNMESILVTWDVSHWLRSALKLAAR